MSKQKQKTTVKAGGSGFANFDIGKIIPEKFQIPASVLAILIFMMVFFSPVYFGDKTTQSGDLIQMQSMREYVNKDHAGFSLWNPYIFCGMPAIVTASEVRWFDLVSLAYSYASKLFIVFFKHYNSIYTINFLILALTAFMLMRFFGAGKGVSLFVAFVTAFSTGIAILFFIGHITKLITLSVIPLLLLIMLRLQKQTKLIDFLLAVLGLHFMLIGNHVQIIFYFLFLAIIYYIYYFAHAFVTKNDFLKKQLVKSVGVFAIAGAIALLMSYDTLTQIYEYKPFSTRGTKSIAELNSPAGTDSDTDSYTYNTNWSFSPGEVLTFIVPSYYGFGKSTYNGPLTNGQDVEVNTYFGQMPFVDTAMYMGIVVFFLAVFAVWVKRKDPFVRFLSIAIIFFLLLSFGRTFPLIFNLVYNYFPLFDNFRTPSMVLHMIQLLVPVLAGLGLLHIISAKDAATIKILKNSAFVFTGIFILSLLLGGIISTWFSGRVAEYAASIQSSQQQMARQFEALTPYMADMFRSDMMIGFALTAAAFWIAYLYVTDKLSKDLFVGLIIIVAMTDLVRINLRGETYADAAQIESSFTEPSYIATIKNQGDKEPYRILNIKQDGSLGSLNSNSNFNVNFLQEDFYGYSAVKPRSYQDYMDITGPVNPTLWRMLNVKYIVSGRQLPLDGFTQLSADKDTYVYRNESALPRAYFVDSVGTMPAFEMLQNFRDNKIDPKHVAFAEGMNAKIDRPDSTASVVIADYKEAHITIEAKASGNNFLFFGTTYFPHGWKAYIDGNETEIFKTNHGFQGIVVPQGSHKVEFVYMPRNFVIGKYMALALSLLLAGGLGFVIVKGRKQNEGAAAE